MKVPGKVIVVTGAGSGMGRQLTIELVSRGAKVAAIDLREESLLETKTLAGGSVETFVLDITDAAAVAELPQKIEAALGSVDGLINNAGIIQPFVKINELTLEQAARVMKVNFDGPLMMTKAFLPGLINRPEAHILNVSSMGAYAPVPGQSVYGASKAAIKLFTEGLRSELAATNIGVTIVFPGAIATNIAANSGMAMPADAATESKFKTTPAPIAAHAMIEAIEHNRPRITIGSDARLMDIISRINPVFAANLIQKQMASLLK
ncbi:SDR family NAD(P)-dependent oxidoreductase [Rhodoluna sp. KAS3]|uniref:SDR family NAD(P)-dependent oxidoreductase n=1 Tax=Rhodoluna sp. KAS3 TaxID=942880 RepID=UPI00222FFA2A|nr:SDR family NAD(P)-dependent oxidoreductase [Rhodoluna sp. KAS3]BDS49224.1 short-chain dehydrogenase [Rhodoluna sp. KAS3]